MRVANAGNGEVRTFATSLGHRKFNYIRIMPPSIDLLPFEEEITRLILQGETHAYILQVVNTYLTGLSSNPISIRTLRARLSAWGLFRTASKRILLVLYGRDRRTCNQQ